MKWTQLRIKTINEAEDVIISTLYDIGLEGAQIEDKVPLTEKEKEQMFVDIMPDGPEDVGVAYLNFFVEQQEGETIEEHKMRIDAVLADVKKELDELKSFMDIGEGTVTVSETEDIDWMNNWKQYFKPLCVGERLWVTPTWVAAEVPAGRTALRIDPGSSFGTGQHDTTKLCLGLLETCVTEGCKVLDIGCGSGILSIGAMLLGAGMVQAIDIEQNAADSAIENAVRNGIDPETYHAICGNILEDETLVASLGDGYDVVCANIVSDILIAMRELFVHFMRDGAALLLSGIIDERLDEVVTAMEEVGLHVDSIQQSSGWAAVKLTKTK